MQALIRRLRLILVRKALITGATGQDGSYLAEFLLAKGYEVHGVARRTSAEDRSRLDGIFSGEAADKFHLHRADMGDGGSLGRLLSEIQPHEVYNLAAQSHVGVSFEVPEQTVDSTALGLLRLLEALRCFCPTARFYQASSSEMFGSSSLPQNENSPLRPFSPYGCAKTMGHCLTGIYREAHGLFAVSGILFNHESPRRGEEFVTRKITKAVASIARGRCSHVALGNLDACRDWGYAADYVEAMWMMLQQDEPEDFVVGTGESHSVREFCERAFAQVGLDWREHVRCDPALMRPIEIANLISDPSRARETLGWKHTVGFEDLVALMVDADLSALST